MTSYLTTIILFAIAVVVHSTPLDADQPAFSCPTNEEYYKCSQIHCYKTCKHLTSNPACPIVSANCYSPACECVKDYLRNDQGTCIPFKQCENWDGELQHTPY